MRDRKGEGAHVCLSVFKVMTDGRDDEREGETEQGERHGYVVDMVRGTFKLHSLGERINLSTIIS